MPTTLIATKKNLVNLFTTKEAVKAIEEAFKAFGQEKVQMPPKSYLYFDKGDLRSMPAFIATRSINMSAIKSVNVHPDNPRKFKLPSVMGIIILTDPQNGFPLAILDGTYLTQCRTGAAAGVATKYLSRKDSKVASFIGNGAQSYSLLDSIIAVRSIKKIHLFDLNPLNSSNLMKHVKKNYRVKVEIANSIEEACKNSDIITTATPSRNPIIKHRFIKKGVHINAIGADSKGKQEIDPEILRKSQLVIDSWDQCSHSGEINVPLSKELINKSNIHGELGYIVAGKLKGRLNNDKITVFDSTGLAIQDVAIANLAYKKIKFGRKRILKVEMF